MGRSFTRQELYDLVWSQPRTALAKQLGVSDVWIGKKCRAARIPMPPAGHWASAQHGKVTIKPPLPIRLPGQPRILVVGEESSSSRWVEADDLEEPILPPVTDENIDVQVDAALSLIGRVDAAHRGKQDVQREHRPARHVQGCDSQQAEFPKPRPVVHRVDRVTLIEVLQALYAEDFSVEPATYDTYVFVEAEPKQIGKIGFRDAYVHIIFYWARQGNVLNVRYRPLEQRLQSNAPRKSDNEDIQRLCDEYVTKLLRTFTGGGS